MHLLGVGGCGIGINLDPCSPLGQLSRRLYFRAQTASFWGTGQFLPTLVSTSSSTTLPLETIGQSTDPIVKFSSEGAKLVRILPTEFEAKSGYGSMIATVAEFSSGCLIRGTTT